MATAGDPPTASSPGEPASGAQPTDDIAAPDSGGPVAGVGDRFEPDLALLNRAEATFSRATEVLDLVDRGDLDGAEAALETLRDPSAE